MISILIITNLPQILSKSYVFVHFFLKSAKCYTDGMTSGAIP